MANPNIPANYPLEGGCACGETRYKLHAPPMITHCCHCTGQPLPTTTPSHAPTPPSQFQEVTPSSPPRAKPDCQTQSGSAFNINALIEHFNLTLTSPDRSPPPLLTKFPAPRSQPGGGQTVTRCPQCMTVLWTTYTLSGPRLRFLRVGTLDKDPSNAPGEGQGESEGEGGKGRGEGVGVGVGGTGYIEPDVHIFTKSKVPWLVIPEGKPAFREFYGGGGEVWTKEAVERRGRLFAAGRGGGGHAAADDGGKGEGEGASPGK